MAARGGAARRYRPDRIVIALPDRRGRLPLDLLLKLKVRDGITVDEADAFYERLTGKIGGEGFRLGQVVFAQAPPRTRLYKLARRLLDVALGIIIGLPAAPLLLLIALAIRLGSRRAIVFV